MKSPVVFEVRIDFEVGERLRGEADVFIEVQRKLQVTLALSNFLTPLLAFYP